LKTDIHIGHWTWNGHQQLDTRQFEEKTSVTNNIIKRFYN